MTSLITLYANGCDCGINDEGLKNCTTLVELSSDYNPAITKK